MMNCLAQILVALSTGGGRTRRPQQGDFYASERRNHLIGQPLQFSPSS